VTAIPQDVPMFEVPEDTVGAHMRRDIDRIENTQAALANAIEVARDLSDDTDIHHVVSLLGTASEYLARRSASLAYKHMEHTRR
jgi:hypothetical protein